MDDEMSANSSDQSTVSSDDSLPSVKMERCLLGKSLLDVPDRVCEEEELFYSLFSMETWERCISPAEKAKLMKLLPVFPKDNEKEVKNTLEHLFSGKNFKFGNPVQTFFTKLRDGYYNEGVAKIANNLRKAQYREYRHRQRAYHIQLLKDILISREKLLQAASGLPPDVPVKMEQLQPSDKAYATARIEDRTKRRYFRELQEVREECNALETSSEDENFPEGPPPKLTKKQKKQLHTMEQSLSPDINRITSTMSVLPLTGKTESSSISNTLLQSPSVIEITDEQFREMLFRHRKRRSEEENHPALNVAGITLEGVIERTHSIKRAAPKTIVVPEIVKEPERKPKPKLKKKKRAKVPINAPVLDSLGFNPSMTVIKPEPVDPQNEVNMLSDSDVPPKSSSLATCVDEEPPKKHINFFCLLREMITCLTEKRATVPQLQECVRVWEETSAAKEFPWFGDSNPKKWSELVMSALEFLAGELLGVQPKNFVPYIDYKEKLMQYVWVGYNRDSDIEMSKLYLFWLPKKDDSVLDTYPLPGVPPPPRVLTNWTVEPTTPEEKSVYQSQELLRYQHPHKAFTFRLHSYESVVGPVKGIYGEEMACTVSSSKAREHSLLVPTRPACVTLLSLVRDAVARSPNGEGTRVDISELLKDSQFLADATDQQLQTVVSGALDRLHYEKDPCVKYDVQRKLWIYLHRNRDEIEFEKIHQAQAQAVKAKKSIPKSKPNRSKSKDATLKANVPVPTSSSVAEEAVDNKPKTSDSTPSVTTKASTKSGSKSSKSKQELAQSSIVKKVDTEVMTKLAHKRSSKTVTTSNADTVNTSGQMKLVGQPQLVQSTQMSTISNPTTPAARPVFTTAVPSVARIHTKATVTARAAAPQLITMQPGMNPSSAVRCSLNQGQRLPHSAMIRTVLSQATRAQLNQALTGHGQPVLMQSSAASTNTSISSTLSQVSKAHIPSTLASQGQPVILQTTTATSGISQKVSNVSRTQLSSAVVGPGHQVILHTTSPSTCRAQTTIAGQTQPVMIQTSTSSTQAAGQSKTVLTNMSQNRKSPVQSTHAIFSQVGMGQRPALLTTVKPGASHLVQRSISLPDSRCLTPQTIQLLTPQTGINLAGQRITTSQVNLPVNINKNFKANQPPTGHPTKLNLDPLNGGQDTVSSASQIATTRQLTQVQQVAKPVQSQSQSMPSEIVEKHQNLSSPLTLHSVQNTPSRPSSTGSSQSLPSPKALVASINAAQLVGDLNSANVEECSPPITIPQVGVSKPEPVTLASVSRPQFSSSQSAYVHQLLTKGHVTLPIGEKTSGLKASMSGITHTVLLKPDTTALTSASSQPSPNKPVVAHIISSPQVVSVGNILAQGPKQAIRIHGSNIVRPNQMIGQQVGVLQPCSASGVSRLALVSQTNSATSSPGGTTTKLVAVGPGGHLGVVDAAQLASLTRAVPSQLHMSNKPMVINTQSGLKIVSGTPVSTSSECLHLAGKSGSVLITGSQGSAPSESQTVSVAKTCSQTYVMAALTGSSMHPVTVPTVSGLQGVKVIPVAQPGGKGHVNQPMLARILTPVQSIVTQAAPLQTMKSQKPVETTPVVSTVMTVKAPDPSAKPDSNLN